MRDISPFYRELLSALSERGVRPTLSNRTFVRYRIELIGDCERRKLGNFVLPEIDSVLAGQLLGWGFAITEFLIAPCLLAHDRRTRACSLGALVNFMVVVADRLLDAGKAIEQPLVTLGESHSPVQQLLSLYFSSLAVMNLDKHLFRLVQRTIALMYEAEIATTSKDGRLSHYLWLRKCCLPLILMTLPAWAEPHNFSDYRVRHVRWLYRVGRFLGIVDDAVDYLQDIQAGQPNYFIERGRTRSVAIERIADWGAKVLDEWDSIVPSTGETKMSRETFLQTIWGW